MKYFLVDFITLTHSFHLIQEPYFSHKPRKEVFAELKQQLSKKQNTPRQRKLWLPPTFLPFFLRWAAFPPPAFSLASSLMFRGLLLFHSSPHFFFKSSM